MLAWGLRMPLPLPLPLPVRSLAKCVHRRVVGRQPWALSTRLVWVVMVEVCQLPKAWVPAPASSPYAATKLQRHTHGSR